MTDTFPLCKIIVKSFSKSYFQPVNLTGINFRSLIARTVFRYALTNLCTPAFSVTAAEYTLYSGRPVDPPTN
jgi:hypothetical protein